MSTRSLVTNITPLPAGVSRESAVAWLHDHREMIGLNPLVIRHERCEPHQHAPNDEHGCHWYEMTDAIDYLPWGLMKREVAYKAAFHNLPNGLQTHVYAPAGLDLREKWTVGGSLPGEAREPVEMGVEAPREGLYIREDVDMRCNFLLAGFVKKNLNKAHKVLVDRLVEKAAVQPHIPAEDHEELRRSNGSQLGQNLAAGSGTTSARQPVQELPANEREPVRTELAA